MIMIYDLWFLLVVLLYYVLCIIIMITLSLSLFGLTWIRPEEEQRSWLYLVLLDKTVEWRMGMFD